MFASHLRSDPLARGADSGKVLASEWHVITMRWPVMKYLLKWTLLTVEVLINVLKFQQKVFKFY